MDPRLLFVYANPASSTRLRLELEDRRISEVLGRVGLPDSTKRSIHAASWRDLTHGLAHDNMEILHFSGHGSKESILLETSDAEGERQISVQDLEDVFQLAGFRFRGFVCISCFSAEALRPLVRKVPYIVAVEGEVLDAAAIDFVGTFYSCFFETNSIERAFRVSAEYVRLEYGEKAISPVLLKGQQTGEGGRSLVRTAYREPLSFLREGMDDEISIDITAAVSTFEANLVERDSIVSLVQRKMRYHKWIFRYPRERALIPMGPYVGIFSWSSLSEPVICHRLLRISMDAPQGLIRIWIDMITTYNDFTVGNKYRSVPNPAAVRPEELVRAADELLEAAKYFAEEIAENSDALGAQHANPVEAMMATWTRNAELALSRSERNTDHALVIVGLEAGLSAFHDVINYFCKLVTGTNVEVDAS